MADTSTPKNKPFSAIPIATEGNQKKDSQVKPELRVGSRTCHCQQCGLYFAGVGGFDSHLIGGATVHPRCRTPEQMRERGMVTNDYGVWLTGTPVKFKK